MRSEAPVEGLAVAFINQRLAELDLICRAQLAEHTGGYYWGRVERGTYLDASFDDDEHGWIHDACWEPTTTTTTTTTDQRARPARPRRRDHLEPAVSTAAAYTTPAGFC